MFTNIAGKFIVDGKKKSWAELGHTGDLLFDYDYEVLNPK